MSKRKNNKTLWSIKCSRFETMQHGDSFRRLPDKKGISFRWECMVNNAKKETERKFKARIVSKLFQNKRGIQFNATFTPVSKMSSFFLLLPHAHKKEMIVTQCDIKYALLKFLLDAMLFMRLPAGFIDLSIPHQVCFLKKTLYGLK